VNIWQSYRQERGCLVHFLRLSAVLWPGAQSARDNVLASNFAKYSLIKKKSTDRLSNKPFLIWLLITPPHLKYVATLACNLSLLACFSCLKKYRFAGRPVLGTGDFTVYSAVLVDDQCDARPTVTFPDVGDSH